MKAKKILSAASAALIGLSAFSISAFADEKELVESNVFSGSNIIDAAWTLGPSVQTTNGSGKFDPTEITADGYFAIDYTGTEGAVYLAFSEWTTEKWASVNAPSYTVETETGYRSVFSFDDCMAAYGTADFSDVDAICAGTGASTVSTEITNISWFGYPAAADLGETAMLYKGSATASTKDTNLTFFYTKHVGGDWDAAQINEGSYFYVEYTGAEDGIYLALASASGSTQWVAVYPDETGTTADGRYYSKYSYDNFSKLFGTNFARLDQIQAYSAKNEEVTLKRIAYFEGEGAPVDTTDGTWDRPDTGIAFIGDSIVQNPLVDSAHLKNCDWNTILDRTDCVNYGIGGQTTDECSKRINELSKKNYSKVVMLCGINDIGHGLTNDEIIANYETMFASLNESNPDMEIFVISVLPTTEVFYTDAQDRIVALDNDLKAMTEKHDNVTYVDCYSSFISDTGYAKPELVFDGLHPNLDGYAVIASILNPYLNGEVESSSNTDSSENDSSNADISSSTDSSSTDDTSAVNSANSTSTTSSKTNSASTSNPATGSAAPIAVAGLALCAGAVMAIKKHR